MGYEDLDDMIRVATRLRGRIEESKDRTFMLEEELKRMEGLIAARIAALKVPSAPDDAVR
jgi:hypothetical protein